MEFDDEFFDNLPYLSEVSCILQDYINARLLYLGYGHTKLYEDCLDEVIQKRADAIRDNKN